MKNIIILFITILLLALIQKNVNATEIKECPMSSAETLVCEVVLCTIGIAIPASRPKCIQVHKEFAIYLATLGFWSKPPSCKTRDLNCNKIGKAKAKVNPNICNDLDTQEERNACRAAAGDVSQEYCDTFSGNDKLVCESQID